MIFACIKRTSFILLTAVFLVTSSVFLAVDTAYAQNPTDTLPVNQSSQGATNSPFSIFDAAGVGCGESGINPLKGIADFFYECLPMGALYVSGKLLSYAGSFFDNFLFFAITSDYLRLDVIDTMWSSILSLANITFILVLIYKYNVF